MIHLLCIIFLIGIGLIFGYLILTSIMGPKAFALAMIMVGVVFCLGSVGMLIGIPMILIGATLFCN